MANLVKDVMTSQPHFLAPTDSIKKAAEFMHRLDCGIIPIGNGERLLGMVTDRDIVIRGIAQGKNPEQTALQDIMSSDVWYVFAEDSIETAAKSMEEKQVRRLVVLDKNKQFVGIVSLGDLSTKGHNAQLSGEIIERISQQGESRAH